MSVHRFIIIVCVILFSNGVYAAEQIDSAHQQDPAGTSGVMLKTMPDAVQNLLKYALSNEGISYRRGGASPENGFDCSGFVRYVFDRVEGVALPHGSNAISQIGDRIEKTELLPGDLVFFRILHHAISHVGIYLGNDQFIHASSSRTGSVIVSRLNESYWTKHFTLARRIALPAELVSSISEDSSPSPSLRLDSSLRSVSNN